MNKKTVPLIVIVVALIIGLGALVFNAPKKEMTPGSPVVAPTDVVVLPTNATELEKAGLEGKLPAKAVILVTETGFSPNNITVPVGTEVTWINQTKSTVNVSSDDHPTHTKYPTLNLGDFIPNKSVVLVFDTAGSYSYHNHLKFTQTGVITVTAQ